LEYSSLLNGGKNMEKRSFREWLMGEKGLSYRSACDVLSRLGRVESLTGVTQIDNSTILKLEESDGINGLSTSVISQLKRSVKLALEFSSRKTDVK
jgi:hypothetical protein